MSGSLVENGRHQIEELGTELEALLVDNVFFVSSQLFTIPQMSCPPATETLIGSFLNAFFF